MRPDATRARHGMSAKRVDGKFTGRPYLFRAEDEHRADGCDTSLPSVECGKSSESWSETASEPREERTKDEEAYSAAVTTRQKYLQEW